MKLFHITFLGLMLIMTLSQELPKSIVDIAKATNEHTILVAALYKTNFIQDLSKANPVTLFAPNDEAFRELKSADILNDPDLLKILKHHIVSKKWTVADLIAAIDAGGGSTTLETLGGDTLTLTVKDGNIIINDEVGFARTDLNAGIYMVDLEAEDGIIHTVDKVLPSK